MPVPKSALLILPVAALAGVLALQAGAQSAPKVPAAAVATPASQASNQAIVAAANAFLATLTDDQKKAASFAFADSAQRALWSNFPQGIVSRKGVRTGDLNATQRAALDKLLSTVLSPDGVRMVNEQMAADDDLKANPGSGGGPGGGGGGGPPSGGGAPGAGPPAGGPPGGGRRGPGGGGPGGGGGGGLIFGSDLYYAAFLGAPSVTQPWMFQFGGHHLAINATVAGGHTTIAPSLTGGQPVKFVKDGKTIYIVEKEVTAANALMAGLTADQRQKVVISNQLIDLVLGPGHDGQTLQPEGLPASAMTNAQKTLLLNLIGTRIGILNTADFDLAMAPIRRNLDQTYFAWYGPTADAGSAYFRVTGPTLTLEFSPQSMGGDASNHLHNMYRDPTNDYGAAWASLK